MEDTLETLPEGSLDFFLQEFKKKMTKKIPEWMEEEASG